MWFKPFVWSYSTFLNLFFVFFLFIFFTSGTECVSCAAAGPGSSASVRHRRPRRGYSCRSCGRTPPSGPPTAAGRRTARCPRRRPRAAGGRAPTPRQRPRTSARVGASLLFSSVPLHTSVVVDNYRKLQSCFFKEEEALPVLSVCVLSE